MVASSMLRWLLPAGLVGGGGVAGGAATLWTIDAANDQATAAIGGVEAQILASEVQEAQARLTALQQGIDSARLEVEASPEAQATLEAGRAEIRVQEEAYRNALTAISEFLRNEQAIFQEINRASFQSQAYWNSWLDFLRGIGLDVGQYLEFLPGVTDGRFDYGLDLEEYLAERFAPGMSGDLLDRINARFRAEFPDLHTNITSLDTVLSPDGQRAIQDAGDDSFIPDVDAEAQPILEGLGGLVSLDTDLGSSSTALAGLETEDIPVQTAGITSGLWDALGDVFAPSAHASIEGSTGPETEISYTGVVTAFFGASIAPLLRMGGWRGRTLAAIGGAAVGEGLTETADIHLSQDEAVQLGAGLGGGAVAVAVTSTVADRFGIRGRALGYGIRAAAGFLGFDAAASAVGGGEAHAGVPTDSPAGDPDPMADFIDASAIIVTPLERAQADAAELQAAVEAGTIPASLVVADIELALETIRNPDALVYRRESGGITVDTREDVVTATDTMDAIDGVRFGAGDSLARAAGGAWDLVEAPFTSDLWTDFEVHWDTAEAAGEWVAGNYRDAGIAIGGLSEDQLSGTSREAALARRQFEISEGFTGYGSIGVDVVVTGGTAIATGGTTLVVRGGALAAGVGVASLAEVSREGEPDVSLDLEATTHALLEARGVVETLAPETPEPGPELLARLAPDHGADMAMVGGSGR